MFDISLDYQLLLNAIFGAIISISSFYVSSYTIKSSFALRLSLTFFIFSSINFSLYFKENLRKYMGIVTIIRSIAYSSVIYGIFTEL